MKKIFVAAFFVITTGLSAQITQEGLSIKFIQYLTGGDYASACEMYDSKVASKLDAATMEKMWGQMQGQMGKFVRYERTEVKPERSYVLTNTLMVFEKGGLILRLAFDEEMRIAGIFFLPGEVPKPSPSPKYAKASKFRESDFVLKSGVFELPAKLCEPVGKTGYPVVVLVHGSGPNDMDETLGPNKVFRDIAHGLAGRGIATIRYDKRTLVYGAECADDKTLTLQQETVDDALAAVEYAVSLKNADAGKVYVLGHSLGGHAAPRIASQTKLLAGIIIMAGNARSLDVLISEQLPYLFQLDGSISNDEQETINMFQRSVEKLRGGVFTAETPDDSLPMGISLNYWLDMIQYKPLELVKLLDIRILVLQGERDYQVRMTDFHLWKQALEGNPRATFKSFKQLNHLMMKGKGKGLSTPSEYDKPSNVDKKVIDTIVRFITAQ
jgi:uncharacterized protein